MHEDIHERPQTKSKVGNNVAASARGGAGAAQVEPLALLLKMWHLPASRLFEPTSDTMGSELQKRVGQVCSY